MNAEFNLIFHVVGWENFWDVSESNSKLLTIEFLGTLKVTDMGVDYRFFTKEYSSSWKDLSLLLGFDAQCVVDVDSAIQDFDKVKFWRKISGKANFFCSRTNDVHNPTLCFMHKWLGMTMFPRSKDELKLIYAMVKERKFPL